MHTHSEPHRSARGLSLGAAGSQRNHTSVLSADDNVQKKQVEIVALARKYAPTDWNVKIKGTRVGPAHTMTFTELRFSAGLFQRNAFTSTAAPNGLENVCKGKYNMWKWIDAKLYETTRLQRISLNKQKKKEGNIWRNQRVGVYIPPLPSCFSSSLLLPSAAGRNQKSGSVLVAAKVLFSNQ